MRGKLKWRSLLLVALIFAQIGAFSQGAVYPVYQEVCGATTSSITLTYSAVGTSTISQWQQSTNGAAFANIAPGTPGQNTLTVPTTTPGVYRYRTFVDKGGGVFDVSDYAEIVVYAASQAGGAVTVTTDPSTRCNGNNTGSVVLGAGFTGTVQNWVFSTNNAAPWLEINQASTALTYDNLSTTTYFKAVVKNGVCPSVLSTNTAVVNVAPVASGGTVTASTSSICQGSSSLLNVSGQVGTTFDWQRETTPNVFTNVGTGGSYNLPTNLTAGTYNYRLQSSQQCRDALNATITQTSGSNIISIAVAAPTATTNPIGDRVVASNDPTVFSVQAIPVNGSIVRWELSTDNAQWTPLSANSNNYNYNNLTQSTWYRVITRNGACTEVASSVPVKITVAKGGTLSTPVTAFCNPSSAGTITAAGLEGTSWTWETAIAPFNSWTTAGANTTNFTFNALTETTRFRVNMNNGLAFSPSVEIVISNPSVAGTLTATSQAVCASDATMNDITLAGNTGNVVRWESSTTNGAPWTVINNTNTTLNYNLLNTTTFYRAVVKSGACTETTTSSIQILVTNGGTTSGSTEICENDANVRSISLSGQSGTILRWERSLYDGGTQTWLPYVNQGNGGSATLTYSGLITSARYRAVIQSSCVTPVYSSVSEVIVYSTTAGGSISGTATVVPGNNSGTLTLIGRNGRVLRWETSLTGSAPWTTINDTNTAITYNNLLATTFYRAIVKNGPCAQEVSSNTAVITVARAGFVSQSVAVCSADNSVRTLTLSDYSGTINRWQRSVNNGQTWINIPASANTVNFTFSGLTQTTLYRAVIVESGNELFSTPATVTVNPLPVPAFTATNPCLNTSTQFTNNSTIASGQIVFTSWSFGDNNSSLSSAPTYMYQAPGTYNVTLTVISNNICRDSITLPVSVRALPTVDFTASNTCAGQSVQFNNNSSMAGNTLTYTWRMGDNNTRFSQNPAYTYPNFGTYNVRLTALASNGCSDSISKSITIHENPTANFVLSNRCAGQAVQLTNSSSITSGNLTHNWNLGNNTSTTLTNPSVTYPNHGNYQIKLVTSSPFGCRDSITKTVFVHPIPSPNFTFSNVCFGDVSSFNNTSSLIPSGNMFYNWNFGDGNTATVVSPNRVFSAAGTYNVTLQATSDSGCVASISKQVVIYQVPTVNFTMNNACQNDTVSFLNFSSLSSDTISFLWNFGTGQTSTLKDPKRVYPLAGAYQVSLTATSNLGCARTETKTVNVWANPTASFTSTSVCEGLITGFNGTSSTVAAPNTITSYLYDFGNGTTSNLQNPNFNFGVAGTYPVSLTVTTNRGCTHQISNNVNVLQRPTPSFTQQNVCNGTAMAFTNTSTNLVNPATFAWNFGDQIGTSTQQAPNYTYLTAGNFNVTLTVTNANNCSANIVQPVSVWPNAVPAFSFNNACENANVQFTNNSTLSNGIMNFAWTLGNGQTSTNAAPSTSYSAWGSYPVSLTVTTDRGCVTAATQNITVNQNPIVSFGVAGVCYNQPSLFINSSTLNQPGTLAYNWNFGDQTSDVAPNPVKTYASPGTYNVTLSATSNNGCTGSASGFAVIYPMPFVNFNVAPVCEEAVTSFDNLSTIESGTFASSWNFGNSTTSTDLNPSLTYLADGTYNVQLVITSNFGCKDSIVKQAVVHDIPVVDFSATSVCEGETTQFTNQTTLNSTSTVASVLWDFGDAGNSVQNNPAHTYATAGVYNTSLRVTTDKGCIRQTAKDVTVNFLPVPDFTAQTVCFGDLTEFVNTSTAGGGSGTLSFAWTMPDGATYNVNNPSHLFQNSGVFNVLLNVTTSQGNCARSITKSVEVWALPEIVMPKDTTLSLGHPFSIDATASVGSYEWTPAAGLSATTVINPVATPKESTTYLLSVVDANGCFQSASIRLNIEQDYELIDIYNSVHNIITPNGDGKNDTWFIENISFYPGTEVMVYDRWGVEVFKTIDYKNDWVGSNKQGDLLPDGTYYFIIQFPDGVKPIKGALTILTNRR